MEQKVRSHRCSLLLPTVSFRLITFVLEQNVLNASASVPVGKALHPPASPRPASPRQFAKTVHSHQLSLRLQAASRSKTIGSWAQNTSLLDADCSSTGSRMKKKALEVKKQYYNTGYLSLSPPLPPPPPLETFTGALWQVSKHLKE